MSTSLSPRVPVKKEYKLLPQNIYNAIIDNLEDDTRPRYNKPEEKEKYIKFTFRITEKGYEDRKMWANATPSLFPGSSGLSSSTLYAILSAVNNKNYTEEESAKITAQDINELEGKSLRLVIKQAPNQKGEMRNKIDTYLPAKENMTEDEKANEMLDAIPTVESEDPNTKF